MAYVSDPAFRSFHALRIKGFATVQTIAEVADLSVDDADDHLRVLRDRELALYREALDLWQLTPAGKVAHVDALAADVPDEVAQSLRSSYSPFLELNEVFKVLCTDWQLRDGLPNDHENETYDGSVIARLGLVHEQAMPVVDAMGNVLDRLSPYGQRLTAARQRLLDGNTKMLTGVMCNSYHDVWMELHEDLLLTQRLDRASEGSY
jgi:hypothetical protein